MTETARTAQLQRNRELMEMGEKWHAEHGDKPMPLSDEQRKDLVEFIEYRSTIWQPKQTGGVQQ